MSKLIAVSFENEIVKIVYASSGSGRITVQKELVIKDEEFDDFLKTERASHFTVVCNFKKTYQDVLLLPPVKEKVLKKLVEAELRKKSPELKEFSYYHTILGESLYEGRKMTEIFAFAVSNDELFQVIERFEKHGKVIDNLYSDIISLSFLVSMTSDAPKEPALYVSESGTIKNVFLVKNGKVVFTRNLQSSASGINDMDAQNINMTVNYCRQTLRTNPAAIILVGSVGSKFESSVTLAAPVVVFSNDLNAGLSPERTLELITPISALQQHKGLEESSIYPEDSRAVDMQKKALNYCAVLFLLLSIGGMAYLRPMISETKDLKEKITVLRKEIAQMETVTASYRTRTDELKKYMPNIQFINSIRAYDAKKILVNLSFLAPAKSKLKDITINDITITAEEKSSRIQLKGSVQAANFADMEKNYQSILTLLKNNGLEVSSQSLSINDKKFQIEARLKG